ncbi:MAG: FeoA family protein [Bacillota bacterium]
MYLNLANLPIGQKCSVKALSATGMMRRRLLDLGFVPGATVLAVRKAFLGDPTAYLIRGAVIALRKEEASFIQIQ